MRVPFDLDYPYWIEDKDFDLEYHVRHVALPRPGDWRQLCIQTARIFSRPLDLTRPPWEFTIVEGLDNVPGVAPGSYAQCIEDSFAELRDAARAAPADRTPVPMPVKAKAAKKKPAPKPMKDAKK